MQVPLEISFHGLSSSAWSDAYIREQVQRLERFCDNIVSCRVAVEQPHRHQHTGNPYRVRIELRLPPNKDLVVVHEPVEVEKKSELQPVILNAFKTMERRLKEAVERRREAVQQPASGEQPTGLVVRLFREEGYGFLKTPEGREYYLHQNSVLHNDFARLEIGTEVHFEPQMGEMGPQASTVQIVNKPGAREDETAQTRTEIPPGWKQT